MKIIFLITLILAVLICIESYVGAQHMMHYVPENPDHCHGPNNQDCLAAAPLEYEYYSPENSVEREYSYENNFWPISRSAQHMTYYVPENPDLCRGPNNQDCLAEISLEYENYTPENSVERVYSYDFNFWANSRSFCPKRYSWHCHHKIHECCSDDDCDPIQFCCYENCGNTCQFPIAFPADGVRVTPYDPHCYVDERFVRVLYAPVINVKG